MAIVAGDIDFRLSGGASNSDPDASLGGVKSSVEIVDATVENLFDNVTGAESTSGDTEYRCFYVHNSHGTLALQSAKVFINTDTPSTDSDAEIALGSSPVNGVERVMGTESDDPSAAIDWAATTAYSLADFRESITPNNYLYEVTTAGTSGASEPTWPTTPGGTVVDGTVTWTCRAKPAWETAAGEGNALDIGDIAAGEHKAIWIKRVIDASASAYSSDSAILEVKGDTAA